MSVCWLVGPLVGGFPLYFFGVFELIEHTAPTLPYLPYLVTFSSTALAHLHATRVAVYLVLFPWNTVVFAKIMLMKINSIL